MLRTLRSLLVLLLAVVSTWAQEASRTATLTGFVSDPSGASVVAAKLKAVNTDTGFTSEGQTNETGRYSIPFLNPGPYELRVEAAGFRAYVRTGIELRASEAPRIDVKLELGSINESVSVSGAAPLLETETATASAALASQTLERVPIMQGRVHNLFMYMPGVTDNASSLNPLGQRPNAVGNYTDGVNGKTPVTGAPTGDSTIETTIDALEEVRVMTTGIPAEYGRTGPGLLVSVLKSGTNEVHGTAEDRYMSKSMLHRRYFDLLPSGTRYHQMQFSVSGPVLLPKIYDGRNKTFWFFAWSKHREFAFDSTTTQVPSEEMLNGDFNFGGMGYPNYDPFSTRLESGAWVRDPIPGNKIAPASFDPVVKKFLSYGPWKAPNQVGYLTASGPQQNLAVPRWKIVQAPRFNIKVDHQLSPAHKFFVRYNWNKDANKARENQDVSLNWDLITPGFAPWANVSTGYGVSDTFTISPSMVNELRVSMNRFTYFRKPEADGQGWAAKLGIPNVSPDHFPEFANLGFGVSPGSFAHTASEEFTISEGLMKMTGQHTFKVGWEVSRSRSNNVGQDRSSGSYNFGGTDFPFRTRTGNAFAAFVLGSVSNATFTQNLATWLPRYWTQGLYFQDEFRPNRNLTINLGLRWSYESPFSTKYGQQSQFDPTVVDSVSGKMGAVIHPKGFLAKRDLNNWQPRLGVSWSFRPKFVFRGSFGVLTQDLQSPSTNMAFDDYVATANIQPPPGDPRIAFRLSQGPPTFAYQLNPDGSAPFIGSNYGARSATFLDSNLRMPYILSWSGGIQYQFASTWLVEAMYQGTSGVGLMNNWDINAIPLDISTDRTLLDKIYAATQNYKPYTQFGSVQHYSNYGHSSYHSATVRVEKRYSHGLVLNVFYTRSKALDEADSEGGAGGVTFYNRSLEKALAGYDMTHRFVTTATYDLPFGVGRRFLNRAGLLDKVFGGWKLAWSNMMQSGRPFTVNYSGSPNKALPGDKRPNILVPFDEAVVKDWTIGPHRFPSSAQNPWLKAEAFAYPAAYTAGNLGRNTFRAPFVYWPQGSLSKQWRIYERLTFDLRWDINNPFKGAQLSSPGRTYNTGALGSFGTFSGVLGSFAGMGSRTHSFLVARLQW